MAWSFDVAPHNVSASLSFRLTDQMDYLGDRYAPGLSFVRSAMARAVAKNEQLDPVQYCIKRWGRETEAVRLVRSAVSGGESSSGNWSGLTDNTNSAKEFIDAVAPMTVFGRLQNLRRVAANVPYVASAGSAIAYWVGESKSIPMTPQAFTRSTLAPLKIGTLAVFSNTLLANESAESEALVRRDLLLAAAILEDTAFLDPTNAGSAVSPASITHGAPTVASSGDLSDDLAQAIDAFRGDFASAAWVMSPRMAARIALATGGKGLGAGLGLRGGEMLGLPALVSTASPSTTDGGSIALVDPTNIVAVDEGAELDLSTQATVEMDTAPSGATDTPSSATTTNLVSLFTSDSSGLRLTRRINWRANAGSVVVITGADYPAA